MPLTGGCNLMFRVLTSFWPRSDRVLTAFWPCSGHVLTMLWPRYDRVLTVFWSRSDRILTAFWPRSDLVLTVFWPRSDRVLTAFWPCVCVSARCGSAGWRCVRRAAPTSHCDARRWRGGRDDSDATTPSQRTGYATRSTQVTMQPDSHTPCTMQAILCTMHYTLRHTPHSCTDDQHQSSQSLRITVIRVFWTFFSTDSQLNIFWKKITDLPNDDA